MPKLSLTVPHNLGAEEAARRLRQRFDAIKAEYRENVQELEDRWEGNTLQCRFHASGIRVAGTVTAEPSAVTIDADLPLRAALFKGIIERRVRDELGKLLA